MVAAEMAGAELVAMPCRPQDADVGGLDAAEAILAGRRDGDILPRDGSAVFQPGHADVVAADAQHVRNVPRQVIGTDVAFFNPEEEVLPLAGRFIGGELLDDESRPAPL